MLRVALVGHSQLPSELEVDGADIEIFRAPGGKAYGFYEDERLNEVLDWSGDLVILWLGSNDIKQNTHVSDVVDNITEIKESIEEECGAEVVIILVEPRSYPDDYPVNETRYKKIQRAINKKLERELPDTRFLQFNTQMYQTELSSDGVHFTAEGQELIEDKIRDCIEDFVNDGSSDDSDEESDD